MIEDTRQKAREALIENLRITSEDLVRKVGELYAQYKNNQTSVVQDQRTSAVVTNSDILRGIGMYALSQGAEPNQEGTGAFIAGIPVLFGTDEDTDKRIHLGVVNNGTPVLGADIDGNVFMGSDIQDPATTAWSLFAVDQTYNSESMGAGDILFGDNSSGKANVLWDVSEGRLKFRGGTTTTAYIDTDGTLVATDASIGGWVVTEDSIHDLAGMVGLSSAVTAGDDIRIWAGDTTPADAPFKVTEAGSLTASDATITGSVTATSGTIAGWTIDADEIKKLASNVGITLDSATPVIKVGDTAGNHLQIDGANNRIRSSNYVADNSGMNIDGNTGDAEFNNIKARGVIKTAVFEKDTISSVGGYILVLPSEVLAADMTALDSSTITINANLDFSIGDILRMKDGVGDEWFEVTNTDAPHSVLVVARDKAGAYSADANPAWKKGQAVVNYGPSGSGGIKIESGASPKIACFNHAGSPWTTITEASYLSEDGISILEASSATPDAIYRLKIGDAYQILYNSGTKRYLNTLNVGTDDREIHLTATKTGTGSAEVSIYSTSSAAGQVSMIAQDTTNTGGINVKPTEIVLNSSSGDVDTKIYGDTGTIATFDAGTEVATFEKGVSINSSGADSDTTIKGDTTTIVTIDAGLEAVGIGGVAVSGKKLAVNGDTQLEGGVIINENGADKDTRIEGDTDANLFVVDAGLDAVGIGGAAESGKKLKVTGSVSITAGLAWNGWDERTETWTRTGDYTFTVSGDVTATYRKGTKVRYKDGGAFEYGIVISSSYGAPNTTVTLATNDDYAMAAATITDKAISYIENPEAFPDWFNYTNTIAGSASGSMTWTLTSVLVAKFKVRGATCKYNVFAIGTTGGTASNTLRLSAPITWDSVPYVAATQIRDATSGVTQVGSGGCYSSGYLVAYKADPSSNYGLGTGRAMIQSGEFSF